MLRIVGLTLAVFGLPGSELALAENEQHIQLRTTDETGCYITDGKFTSPTIGVAAGLYHEAWFPKERALRIINVALASGCDIGEPDDVGSTPLIASIIYNEPA
ncbi:hypothetical protein SAMN05216421_0872 [Halopseudomonas xinjiangensis]|uniref:Rap1a immunity protein domain-containing protein n=1 Tax=Halopseudomonas xinjiangensis TaxID=487184 RepID=A0A1H1PAM3_9GAMM|nr:hypothetical protein [Halopseudomonas xinjiangensis]SDS08174.1 hypothetical protein SAMN05216421_0872 [Halopseudomonas xinjiangensis]